MNKHATQPVIVHGFALSGHTHRVEVLLHMLEVPFERVAVDVPSGAQKQPAHMALHPFGQVPAIVDDGAVLWDSAAIMVYLATKYGDGSLLPTDAMGMAEVQRWLAVAAGPMVNGPVQERRNVMFKTGADIAPMQAIAHALFKVMDAHLGERAYLAAGRLTIADLAGYTYVAHAPEGGIALDAYPNLRAWLARVEAAPGFFAMRASAVGLRAA